MNPLQTITTNDYTWILSCILFPRIKIIKSCLFVGNDNLYLNKLKLGENFCSYVSCLRANPSRMTAYVSTSCYLELACMGCYWKTWFNKKVCDEMAVPRLGLPRIYYRVFSPDCKIRQVTGLSCSLFTTSPVPFYFLFFCQTSLVTIHFNLLRVSRIYP